ncbi:MAG: carbon-nitrogen hydrolase family protein [Cytophagales bacterium]|nr:MAG: carbon-nitrogen hydrolase family protein [Cytophagales bacterium]
MKIALGQLLVEGGEPERNLERAEKMIKEAANAQADLILLPETLDFAWTHPSALQEAEPIPGKYSDWLCKAAKEHNIYVCAGLTERKEGKNYNTAIFIDKNGEIQYTCQKINLLEVEFPYYEVGQKIQVIDTEFGKIGINVCADNYLDGLHIGHALAHLGAQMILSPSSWTVDYHITEGQDPYHEKWIKPYSILAKLYGIAVIGTTSVGYIVGGPYEGKKMVGCSLAIGQEGILARGDFNEFAGEITYLELQVPQRTEKGTQIGKRLKEKGYNFDVKI